MELKAYVTNLGKYNEGYLVGRYLDFPTTKEEVQSLLKRIGVDGELYEEIFISDYETGIPGLYDCLGEYESIDELNHLACLLSDLGESELTTFYAALDAGEHTASLADIINLAENLDCYDFHPGVEDEETLGRIYIEDMGALEVPDNLLPYIDFEAYGRDVSMEENGSFVRGGYLFYTGGFKELYSGRDDIPDEHKVFAYPETTIRERMAAYQKKIAEREAAEPAIPIPTHTHDDR